MHLTATLSAAVLLLSACALPSWNGAADRSATRSVGWERGTPGEGDARYTDQSIVWNSCGQGMQCADVYAPLDWDDPQGESITVFLTKHEATGEKLGTLFVNPGGPGSGGANFVAESLDYAVGAPLREHFDVVGWDPRGTGSSDSVRCFDDAELDEYLFGDPRDFSALERGSDAWIAAAREDARAFGDACAAGTGPLLGTVDTVSTARDLDLLRHLLGDETLNYLGYSYGTFIGALYAELFPQRVGKLVLDGVLPPDVSMHEVVREQSKGFEASLRAYVADCLTRESCPFEGSVDTAMRDIGSLIEQVDATPLHGPDGRWISSSTFLTAIITPLYAQESWSMLDDLFSEIRSGQTHTAFYLADFYYGRERGVYTDNSTVAFAAINCLDYPPGGDVEQLRAEAAELQSAAPTIGKYQGFSDLSCAGWPFPGVDERNPVTAAGAAPILVIGTTGDPATPYVWAEQLAEQLESGTLLTYTGEGHTAYAGGGNACIAGAVETYFLSGAPPAADSRC